tara:strand:- start:175 stop:606 length:432 start_codon:yes stop_codon:yes gene_type:complete
MENLHMELSKLGVSKIIYRPHPADPGFFTEIVCSPKYVMRSDDNNLDEMYSAAIVAGWCSSLLMVPILLRKKLITINSKLVNYEPPYWEPLLSYKRIELNLDEGISDEKYCELEKYYRSDGLDLVVNNSKDPLSTILVEDARY